MIAYSQNDGSGMKIVRAAAVYTPETWKPTFTLAYFSLSLCCIANLPLNPFFADRRISYAAANDTAKQSFDDAFKTFSILIFQETTNNLVR